VQSALQGFGVELPSWLTAIDMGVTHGSLLSIVILVACTALVAFGVKESARFNLAITACNLCIILFVIIVGGLYVDKENWRPFSPMGFRGVMRGAAKVFFAYIGFDTVSSLAEEVRHPQRDLPLGISGTLGEQPSPRGRAATAFSTLISRALVCLQESLPLSTAECV
jgi:APA family basic amino acid/polyamine antiporter